MMRGGTAAAVLTLLLAGGCTVGPDYERPATETVAAYKEAPPQEFTDAVVWNVARPADGVLREKWWTMFGDPILDGLEDQVVVSNQQLRAAEARFRQARALVAVNRSAKFPTLSTAPSINSLRDSANRPYPLANTPTTGDFALPFDFSYEIDLWGRIARTVAAASDEAQASATDVETARLSLQSELALDYIGLRSADAQQKLLETTVAAYTDALRLTQNRLEGGAAPESDVAQARTQLEAARVQLTDIGVQRSQFEHAIAILIGKAPAALSLSPAALDLKPQVIPVGLPSELLQRRPDIAAVERRVAEANEQIGIAEAAYYPSVTLGGVAGFEGNTISNWFDWPSLFWAVGASVGQTLFDGGRRRAQSTAALAGYDAAVADYRQIALSAFQQVEDNLAALRILEQETRQQSVAVASAQNSLRIFTNRYEGGLDTYLEVVVAQTTELQNERNDVDILRRRLEATVLLIKALGGGWDAAKLPNPAALQSDAAK